MRLFVLILFITFLCAPAFSAELDLSSTISESWINRASPEEPSTDEEIIAVLAASEHRDTTNKNLAAKYEGLNGNYETVTVAATSESESEMQVITKYKIINRQIYADTRPAYRPRPSSEQENIERAAYRLAVKANGTNSVKPFIVGDNMLSITFDGKCNATVTAKNFDHEVLGKYHFKMCD